MSFFDDEPTNISILGKKYPIERYHELRDGLLYMQYKVLPDTYVFATEARLFLHLLYRSCLSFYQRWAWPHHAGQEYKRRKKLFPFKAY